MDDVQNLIGSYGRYQLFVTFLMFLCKVPIAVHQIAIVFLAPPLNYTCPPDNKLNTCPCENPTFDKSVFTETMAMRWNLICGRKWMVPMSQTIFMFGCLVGSIVFGNAGDKYGRRIPFLVAITVQLITAMGSAVAPYYWLFVLLRYIVGMSVGGTMVISFVILMEFIGVQHREIIASLYQIPFNLGHLLLPLIAYLLRNYSHYLLGISMPNVLLLISICLLPETPRWLIAAGHTEKASKILTKVAKVNKMPTENISATVETARAKVAGKIEKKGNFFDLFRTPNIRRNNLVMAYNWLTCSYCFYGVSQYVGHLSGNMFINVACSAFVVMVSVLLAIPLLQYFGRKTLIIFFNFLCAACLFILAFLPKGLPTVILACTGVIASFIVFVIVYLYTSELFPTVIRNAAMGFSCSMARVGSMVAPFVVDTAEVKRWLPPILFGIVPLIAAVLCFFLPETKGIRLATTIEEGENIGKKNVPPPEPEASGFPCEIL